MESIIYVNTTDKTLRASTTALALPTVDVRLQTHLKLTTYFFAAGADPALISGASFRVALKDYNEPSGSVLALLSAATATGDDYYEFEWASVDSSALRTLIGDAETTDATLEIEWTVGSNVERASMPVTIKNAWIRSEDDAPDPVADASWTWLKARLAAGSGVTFSDNDSTKVRTIAATGGAGSGDVTGPASSTDNALVRFDSTTGKAIQNGNVTQSDDGDLAAVNSIAFDTTPTGAIATQGQAMWNADEATLDIQLNGFVIHTGSHSVYRVKNSTGSTISKGAPVMFAGTDGNSGTLLIQEWDGVGPVEYFLGLLAEDLTDGSSGFAVQFGKLRGITTDGSNYGESWSNGDVIYASATAGELTKTAPAAPNPLVLVCAVVSAHATNGTLFVRPTIGTVAKVAMTVPTGLQVSGSPITNNGTLALSYASGYQGYTTTEASKLSGIESGADVTDATNIATAIDGATAKTTPVDADTLPLIDSAASNVLKKLSWANIKATLKSYFDALYGNVSGPASATDDAIATYDGTTGKLIQSSALKIIGSVLTWASGSSSGSGSGGSGGSVNITGGNGSETDLNSASGGSAGSISLRGGNAASDEFGAYNGGGGGGIQMIGSDATVSGAGNNAGSINTSGGDNGAGGSITTADGGGSLDTEQGYLELGPSGARTTIQAGNSGDVTINLPPADGSSGQFLQTDGAGNWSWSSPSGSGDVVGPASAVNSDVALFDGTTGKLLKAQSGLALMDAIFSSTQGSIIYRNASQWTWLTPGTSGQVLTTQGAGANPQWSAPGGSEPSFVLKTDTASTASSLFSDITDLSITFSASSVSQKITLRAVLYVGSPSTCDDQFVFENEDGVILQGAAAGSRLQAHGYFYNAYNTTMGCVVMEAVYTPGTTSSRTYKVRWKRTGTGTAYLNRSVTDTDSASYSRTASAFILQPH